MRSVNATATVAGENSAPQAGTPSVGTPDLITGEVTGSLNFTDADGDSLTYTATTSSKGNLVLRPDGTFTYTPTQAARLAANNTVGSDADSFTVTASDGQATASIAVNPTIAPAKLVLSTPVADVDGPISTAFSPDGSRAYISFARENKVAVLDTATNIVIKRIDVGEGPQGVAISPDGTRVYVANARGGISVINTADDSVTGIPLPDGLIGIAISPDGTRGFVTQNARNQVVVLDLVDNTVLTTIDGFNLPSDIAVGRDGSRAYVINQGNGPGSVMVIDTATNRVIDTIHVGSPTSGFQPEGLSFSPDGALLYTADISHGNLTVIRTADDVVIDTIAGTDEPLDVSVSPDGSLAYVTDQGNDSVVAIDTTTHAILAKLTLDDHPNRLTVSPDGSQTFVSRTNVGAVSVLSFLPAVNHAPVSDIRNYSAADPTTGAVTGVLGFTDPDGDPLAYTVAISPNRGTVVFNPDGTTFTYTPDPAARHAAAADGAGIADALDHFIIGASDGQVTTYGFYQLSVSPLNHAPGPATALTYVAGLTNLASDFTMSPDGKRAYIEVFDPQTNAASLAMIDTATNAVTRVALHGEGYDFSNIGAPRRAVVSPDGSRIYLVRQDADTQSFSVDVVDTVAGTSSNVPFPMANLYQSADGSHVYGLNTNSVTILDTTTSAVVSVPLSYSVYHKLAVRPDNTGVLVSNLGTLVVVGNDGTTTPYAVPGGYDVQPFASPDGVHAYALSSNRPYTGSLLTVVDIAAGTSHDVAFPGTALTISPDGTHLYTIANHNTLIVLDPEGNAVGEANLDGSYYSTVVSPDGSQLYAYDSESSPSFPEGSSSLAVVDLATLDVNTIPLSNSADYVVFSPNGRYASVGSYYASSDGSLAVIDTTTNTVEYSQSFVGYDYPEQHVFTDDSRYLSLVTYRDDGTEAVITIDVTTGIATTAEFPGSFECFSTCFTPDGHHAYGGVYDEATGTERVVSLAIPSSVDAATGITVGTPAPGTRAVNGSLHFTDADDDTLAYSVQTNPALGTVSVDPSTGAFLYTPTNSGAATTDHFSLLVNDGHGGRYVAEVTVPVAAPNRSPSVTITQVGSADATTGAVVYQVTGTDPDGDAVAYGVTGAPGKGTVVANSDGTYTYTPTTSARHTASADNAAAADKTDAFTITVSDPYGASASATTDVAVSPQNTVPVRSRVTFNQSDESTGNITVSGLFLDRDGDTLTYSVNSDGTRGTVTATPQGYSYTPTPAMRHAAASSAATDADRYDSFVVLATDGHGGTASLPIRITILPGNGAPTANPTTSAPTSAGVVTGSVRATDPDRDALTYSVSTGPSRGTATVSSTGAVTYTPTPAAQHAASATNATTQDKADSFTVTVSDGHGGNAPVVFTPTITPKNTAPKATPTTSAPDAAGIVTGSLGASDADGDVLAYAVTSGPSKGMVTVNPAGAYTYTPTAAALHAASATGATTADKRDAFTVTVSDGYGGTKIVAFTPTIAAKNTGPTAMPTTNAPNGAGVVTGSVGAADADGDTLTFVLTSQPTKGTVTIDASGGFTYRPTEAAQHAASLTSASAASKQDKFTVTVSDGHGGTKAVAFTPTIAPQNAAPITSPSINSTDGATGVFMGSIGAIDPDGDAVTYTVTTKPTKGTVTVDATGKYTYTPTAAARHAASADNATAAQKYDTFTIAASDGHGGTSPASLTVQVAPTNSGPVGAPITNAPNSAGVVTGTLGGSDPDRDTVTYTVTSGPSKGTLTVAANGTFQYTPTVAAQHVASAAGATAADKSDSFTVVYSDGHGGMVTGTLGLTVVPKNAGPTATATTMSPNTSGVVAGAVAGSDSDGDALSFAVTSGPTKGAVNLNATGGFTYTPTAEAQHAASATNATTADKRDTFTVTVSDGHGGTKAVAVTTQILPKNAGPTSNPQNSAPNPVDASVNGGVNGTDPDGDSLVYTVARQPAKGTLAFNPNGSYTYTPTAAARTQASKPNATAADKQDSFVVTIVDGHGGSKTITLTVPVSGNPSV